jgi:hypothetical protein
LVYEFFNQAFFDVILEDYRKKQKEKNILFNKNEFQSYLTDLINQNDEINTLLISDEKSVKNKLNIIEKDNLKKSLLLLKETRDDLIKQEKQAKVDRAIALAKLTNEEILKTFKPIFNKISNNIRENFDSFYDKEVKKIKTRNKK